ncbi:MAG: slipin family protein [bacterium]|jgi:regulator of protease activity HflC (stomatin/prohibitin superfamily)
MLKSGYGATSVAGTQTHPFPLLIFFIFLIAGVTGLIRDIIRVGEDKAPVTGLIWFFGGILLGIMFLTCLRVADQWDRVAILRLGKFTAVRGPGMFFLVPFIDTIGKWVDIRVRTTDLLAEQTLTKDTVPVNVDAVMFWMVYDPKKAALEVEDYVDAVSWAAQTALRDIIGKTDLADLLVGREKLDQQLEKLIDERTDPWGVTVRSVEIRDIRIPEGLQEAMSQQAQAERERQARIILGDSERQIAESFSEASRAYQNNPVALHLRAMNMLFEGLKEKGSLMLVPSSALDSMNLGGLMGVASMGQMKTAPGAPQAASGEQFDGIK